MCDCPEGTDGTGFTRIMSNPATCAGRNIAHPVLTEDILHELIKSYKASVEKGLS